MSVPVIGIDFGNDNCYIAAARAGGIEVITNDYSLRDTPSCVAFHGMNRLLGTGGKNQMITNLKNTIHSFKRLLGRPVDDPFVQQEMKYITYNMAKTPAGGISVNVDFADQQETFTIEQIAAMLFTKLKEIAESALQSKISDCVITIPTFATDAERRALINAVNIAGMNVLKLMNENTAVALCYGLYKQDLPAPDQPPRQVVIVDFGQAALQASLVHFHKGSLKMVGYASDPHLGGRDLDYAIADTFIEEFKTKYRIDVRTNKRAHLRLLTESEKLKKHMSANSTVLPLNIECFMDDKDVTSSMKRVDFEELCAGHFKRVEAVFRQLLEVTGVQPKDIDEVEIVGGSTRIPSVKALIQAVFEKVPSTTLNQDEAICRGAALQAAMLSPSFKVREFNIQDLQPYPIKLIWQDPSGVDNGEMELFPRFHAVPFTKMMTLKRKEPFFLRAAYIGQIPYPRQEIGEFMIKDVRPSTDGEAQKVKIKIRINADGVFTVSSASLHEQKVATGPDAMETEVPNGPEADKKPEETMDTEQPKEDKKEEPKKVLVKSVELPIDSRTAGMSEAQLNAFIEKEAHLIAHDKQERERLDSKNALEEYVYDSRNRSTDESDLEPFLKESEKTPLLAKLDEMENWLYDEGENCQKSVYVQKLDELKVYGEVAKDRKREFEARPRAIEDFCAGIHRARKFVDAFHSGDDKYNHIDAVEVEKVDKAIKEKQQWLDQRIGEATRLTKTCDVPASIRAPAFTAELQAFNFHVNPIMSKPKPKPKVETPPQEAPAPEGQQPPQEETPQGKMEVD